MLIALATVMVALYIFFINMTVVHIVSHRSDLRDIRMATKDIADLTQERFAQASQYGVDYALEAGFVEAPRVNYIVLKDGEDGISYLGD